MDPERIADHARSQKRFAILLIAIGLACGVALGIILANNYSQPNFSFGHTAPMFNIAAVNFVGTSDSTIAGHNQINMTIQNTGSSSWTWTLQPTAQVNSVTGLTVTAWMPTYDRTKPALNCTNGNAISIYIDTHTSPWISGTQYTITMYMTDDTKVTYVATAP
jgi:hypothetical protein